MLSTLALLAHPSQVDLLIEWLAIHRPRLRDLALLAPADLVQPLRDRLGNPADLDLTALPEIEAGGDITLAAKTLAGEVAAIIFFMDPELALAPAPNLSMLLRACQVREVPIALNPATAELALRGLAQSRVGYLIFNPVAGQGNPNQELALIRATLEPQILLNVIMTQPDVDPADQARQVIETIEARANADTPGSRILIASGGDGTVSAVAGAAVGTDVPLGVIPRGTANAFAVALGIPTNLRGACKTILTGHTRQIDAARCNNTPMILLAGLGFEAGMVDRATREMKNRLGTLAYVLAGAQQLSDQQPFRATIQIDGEEHDLTTGAITIANVAPPTSVLAQGFGQVIADDGLLEVTIDTSQTRMQGLNALASLFAAAVARAPVNQEALLCLRASKVKVTTDPPQKLVIDGEVLAANPLEFECLPNSLTVFTPVAP